MPYISKAARERLAPVVKPLIEFIRNEGIVVGEANYIITRVAAELGTCAIRRGTRPYASINAIIGVLECAKLELYRRVGALYEDEMKEKNGDV